MAGGFKIPKLDESSVVIAGGTSGLGLATALRFAKLGVPNIALLARNVDRGLQAEEAVRGVTSKVNAKFIEFEGSDAESVTSAVNEAHRTFGSINILVSAIAATEAPEILSRMDLESIQRHLTAPALPPMYLTRAVYPIMKEQGGGSIVNVASDAAKVPTPGESVLGAAMAAIVMFSRGVAVEGKRDGVRVNVVTPSIIGGTATTARWLTEGFSKKLFEGAIKAAALGVVDADELSELVCFLAGPSAAKMTGQTISMNGGISFG